MRPASDMAEAFRRSRRRAAACGTREYPSARRCPRHEGWLARRSVEWRPSQPTDEVGADFELAVRGLGAHGRRRDGFPRSDRSLPARMRRSKARRSVCRAPPRKSRKSHCGISAMILAVRRQVAEIGETNDGVADLSAEPRDERMRQLEKFDRAARVHTSAPASRDEWCRRGNRAENRCASLGPPPARRRAPAKIPASCRRVLRRRCSKWF